MGSEMCIRDRSCADPDSCDLPDDSDTHTTDSLLVRAPPMTLLNTTQLRSVMTAAITIIVSRIITCHDDSSRTLIGWSVRPTGFNGLTCPGLSTIRAVIYFPAVFNNGCEWLEQSAFISR